MTFDTPVTTLPFVGPRYKTLLEKLGIKTVGDLLYHLPHRYSDLSKITPIDELELDELQVVEAVVDWVKKVRIRGGKTMVTAQVHDASGVLNLSWFNQPYMADTLKQGTAYRIAGEPSAKYAKQQMLNPQVELASKPPVHTGRLVPIYPQTAGISSKWLRARLAPLLSKTPTITPEFLPDIVLKTYDLPGLPQAITSIHAPDSLLEAGQARRRLAFDELLLLQLAAERRKSDWQEGREAPVLHQKTEGGRLKTVVERLPFALTGAQERALHEILGDMSQTTPMNRLLEGDVGSGKTIVAFLAAMAAVESGYQVALMAPTSVLAQQHFLTFQGLLEKLEGDRVQGSGGSEVRRSEVGGGRSPARHASQQLAGVAGKGEGRGEESLETEGGRGKGEGRSDSLLTTDDSRQSTTVSLRTAKSKMAPADITIGTHALIADGVEFEKLGLVIIDEQHRFGVEQRAKLMAKSKQAIHLLTMTATPIPRTLALTAYGDLELSIIDQMPVGRLPVKTHIVPDHKRQDMYGYIAQALDRGEQAYIICPLVEESDNLQSVRAATTEYERLIKVFPKHRLALLHGRMKPAEKDQVLADFKDHRYDLLVATPVVEVGIDVPNATILLIEGAERFGLAQLHQLRGRVGRGETQSYCFLLSDSTQAEDSRRLKHLEHEHSGIRLAEIDLQTRGPGEVYGVRQSGIPELKAASFSDLELIEQARQAAQDLVESGELEHNSALQQQLDKTQRLVEMN